MAETDMELCETHIIGRDTREWILPAAVCPAFRRHHIHAAGFSDARAPYCMQRVSPSHWHMVICSEGEGQVLMAGSWKSCGKNQAYVSPPGVPMGFYPMKGRRWKFTWVYAAPAMARNVAATACSTCDVDANLFETIIRNLHREVNGDGEEQILSAWVQLLEASILRMIRPRKRPLRLQPLWQEIDGNLSYPWSMAVLSQKAGISEEHLRRVSLQETGRTPMKQVAFLRLQRALHLLQTSQLKVSAVAEAVGYTDPFAFSTAFKRSMGRSPSAFMERDLDWKK